MHSVGNFELGTDGHVNAMYNESLNDVDCINLNCNKRISDAGQERSAGRPDNRSIGARSAARAAMACLGPYITRTSTTPHHTGPNTRTKEQASSRRVQEHQDNTDQPTASSSRRSAAKDRASPVTVILHPRRPPYFCARGDNDVHVWTSIVDRWMRSIRGEPSTQLTYIVSLLRGVDFEWYSSFETCIGCPGDWTTVRHAILEQFGPSIRTKKARAAFLKLTQNKMTVFQYADAFESYLAQLEDYDESFYLTKFIFGLPPAAFSEMFVQRAETLLEAKRIAKEF